MSKDLWFAEFEQLYNAAADEAAEQGKTVSKKTYDSLGEMADEALRERLADIADEARMHRKEAK